MGFFILRKVLVGIETICEDVALGGKGSLPERQPEVVEGDLKGMVLFLFTNT